MIRPTSLSFFALFLGTAISGCGGGNGVQAPDTGSIRVTTSTAGENLDPNGYACRVDGGASSAIGINDSHTFSDVRTGEHTVELTGIANNCTVGGDNPRTIVTEGDTLDPDGYMVTLDGNQNRPAGVIDIVTFTDLPQGAHSIELSGIAKNCIVIGANPRNVNITAGQLAEATYDVTCAAAFFDRILFNSDRTGSLDVYVMTPDGSNVTQVTDHPWDEHSVDVSPNGTKIAFTGDWDGNEEIHRMNVDGTDPVNLTNSATRDTRAAWSPDGSKIAFQSDREGAWEIYVMNSDGSGLVRLTHNDVDDGGPTWSPDGNEIAFSSERDGWGQIYVMRSSDGANVRRVTNNQDNDGTPMWSPDGTRIAFHKNRQDNFDIYVINVDGSNEQRLTDDPAFDGLAKWSPDSERIVFASGRDGDFEVYIMNADGSGQTRLTFDGAHDSRPRWAPAR
jgi:dipeptidyl aminopeptidase/acylaminoacyl peptidase